MSRSPETLEVVAAPGLSVANAAHLLGVSEPTVRDWIKRGVLVQLHSAKTTQVTLKSVAEVQHALESIRARAAEDERMTKSLYDAVEATLIFNSGSVNRGLDQFKRGEVEPA